MPRFHLPLIEPDVRISRIRLSDGIREAAHETARHRSFTAVARSFRGFESLMGGYRQHGHSPESSHFQTAPEVRPLPSTGITRLQRYYEPVRHPTRPGPSPRGRPVGPCKPPLGFPVLRWLPLVACRRPYPGRTAVGEHGSFPRSAATLAFPFRDGGSAPAKPVFGACSAFT